MIWENDEQSIQVSQYERTSNSRKGARYKKAGKEYLMVATLRVERCEATTEDLFHLIVLGDQLDAPVRYDFNGQQSAYIEVVSAEKLREMLK